MTEAGGGAHAHSAALVEPPLPDAPIVEEIASARRADRWRRRLIFAAVWIVLVGGLGLFLWNAGRVDAEFIVQSGPYILGGIWITILVSVLSIMLATVLAIVGALGRLSTNPVIYAIAHALRLARPGDAAARPDLLRRTTPCPRPGSSCRRSRPASSRSASTTART